MKKYNNNSGFTMIEVILAIAILGIISISLLTLFTSGIKGIFIAGKSGNELYDNQSTLETRIYQGASDESLTELEILLPEPLSSPNPTSIIIVNGELVEEEGMKIFVPKR